ncbi:MAG: hypothetical protein ACFFBD_27655, partial [Candidatus Hodarchaeota archaeon]
PQEEINSMTFQLVDVDLISELIINILITRSYYYEYLCIIVEDLKGEKIGLASPILFFKALELLIRDINPEEIKLDAINKSFNITTYIKEKCGLNNNLEVVETINNTKKELEKKIALSIEKFPSSIKKAFEERIKSLNQEFANYIKIFKHPAV